MTIVFPPPAFLLWVCVAVWVIVIPMLLLKKGPKGPKITGALIVFLVTAGLLFFFYRSTTLKVGAEGISLDTYGKQQFTWQQVKLAFVVEDVANSEYKPVYRSNGTGLPGFRAGWFKLKNGKSAFLTVTTNTQALMIRADATLYMLSPDDFPAFLAEVKKHITVPKVDPTLGP